MPRFPMLRIKEFSLGRRSKCVGKGMLYFWLDVVRTMAVTTKRSKKHSKKTLIAHSSLGSALIDFIAPLFEVYGDSFQVIEVFLVIGILAWNFSLLPPEKREMIKEEMITSINSDNLKNRFNDIFGFLLYRKNTVFNSDKRFIKNYRLVRNRSNLRLHVESL